MLSPHETDFMDYWEQNRFRKKKLWRQLSIGMPLGVAMAAAILANVYSDWNAASSFLKFNGERLVIVFGAVLLIVVFIVIFSARHRWDMNEQYYKELMAKKQRSEES